MKFYNHVFIIALLNKCIQQQTQAFVLSPSSSTTQYHDYSTTKLNGWVQDGNGEWEWEEDDPNYIPEPAMTATATASSSSSSTSNVVQSFIDQSTTSATATPSLPSGSFKPKQSLGQNFLRDGNTVAKIVKYFISDASRTVIQNDSLDQIRAVELGPGAGAITDTLVLKMKDINASSFQCIEIDPRSIELLNEKHPSLRVNHMDVLQVDYPDMAMMEGGPLSIIGNLPYYITSQILFALADASHYNAVRSATVTMQYEVGRRIVAQTKTKDYGILSVVFQLYADCELHFKIPPTVFYPQPKVTSALLGLHFIGPNRLRGRLSGVQPSQLRRVLTATFQQRRKTVRNSLKKLLLNEVCNGDKERTNEILNSSPLPLTEDTLGARERGCEFALSQELPVDWVKMRPEELTSGQFVELTRLVFQDVNVEESDDKALGRKVWRKMKHGK
jgi:16S rRNA (adenine1518-N6/adenine1519-N6)-dimethyltransferase